MNPSASRPSTLRLLGVPRAELDGVELKFPDRKCIALLALLALDGACTRARIATLLWDEQSDTDARRNLRRELHRLRDAGLDGLLQSDADVLRLHDGVVLDSADFSAACDATDSPRALALYTGSLLEGFDLGGAPAFNEWLAARRETLAQRWRAAAERHCDALQSQGALRPALELATRLLHADTLQESHYRRAMTLHAAVGEREAALALFERCRKQLGRELGLRPLPQTVALAERIRSGQHDAAPAAPVRAPVPALQTLPADAPMVGREPLLRALAESLARQRLSLLRGEAGLGKSRLLRTLLAQQPGTALHEARVSDRRVPFAALVRWLRAGASRGSGSLPTWVQVELARLLPELGTPPPPMTSDTQRLRLFEAVREAWSHWFAGTALHAFDDWQFVDDSSAQWWGWWLGQAPASTRAAVLVAERPGEAGEEAAAVLRDACAAEGSAAIELTPLPGDAIYQLVQRLSGTEHPQRFAHRLWQATGGHPLYALETLQHLLQSELIRVDEHGQWHTPFDADTADYHELPIAPSVQAAVIQRVRALDDATQRLLEAASLTGDDFTLALVSGATALGEWDALRALEAALHARVVTRHPEQPGVYRFEHDLFAQAVAAGLSPERRRLMHRALGQRLAQEGAAPARVAEHFEHAQDHTAACDWRLRALEAARKRMGLADMLAQSARLLALAPPREMAIRAHLARASALLSQAQGAPAETALKQAAALLATGDDIGLHVEVGAHQAFQAMRQDRSESALLPLATLLADDRLSPQQRGRLLVRRSGCLRALGRMVESAADLEAALGHYGDEPSFELGDLLDDMSRTAASQGESAAALAFARRSLAVMEQIDHPGGCSAALVMCGVALMALGRFDEALAELQRARAIAHRHGMVSAERAAILNLVPTLHALGEGAAALRCLEEGYALSTMFGGHSEQLAFIEARYYCRGAMGDLGGALDARPELVAFSLRSGEAYRRHSGLLVATDLLLMLGDGDGAAAEVATVVAEIDAGGLDYFAMQALAKSAWLALVQGRPALARAQAERAAAATGARMEDRAYMRFALACALSACGEHAAACAALDATGQEVGTEVWALYLAGALRVQHAAGAADPALLTQAREEVEGGKLPPLNELDLIDALVLAGTGTALSERARVLAAALHTSLARHAGPRRHFERRFARWLVAPVTP